MPYKNTGYNASQYKSHASKMNPRKAMASGLVPTGTGKASKKKAKKKAKKY